MPCSNAQILKAWSILIVPVSKSPGGHTAGTCMRVVRHIALIIPSTISLSGLLQLSTCLVNKPSAAVGNLFLTIAGNTLQVLNCTHVQVE